MRRVAPHFAQNPPPDVAGLPHFAQKAGDGAGAVAMYSSRSLPPHKPLAGQPRDIAVARAPARWRPAPLRDVFIRIATYRAPVNEMDRLDREHVDGIGDGLSIALGIAQDAESLEEAREAIRGSLLKARLAKDRHNLEELTELASAPAHPPRAEP